MKDTRDKICDAIVDINAELEFHDFTVHDEDNHFKINPRRLELYEARAQLFAAESKLREYERAIVIKDLKDELEWHAARRTQDGYLRIRKYFIARAARDLDMGYNEVESLLDN